MHYIVLALGINLGPFIHGLFMCNGRKGAYQNEAGCLSVQYNKGCHRDAFRLSSVSGS